MEIRSVVQFLEYWDSIRERTRRVITCIPPARLEWTHRAGSFSLGDQVRHLATIERYMYAETVAAGTPITTWKWLRAMVEHEAHHRGREALNPP